MGLRYNYIYLDLKKIHVNIEVPDINILKWGKWEQKNYESKIYWKKISCFKRLELIFSIFWKKMGVHLEQQVDHRNTGIEVRNIQKGPSDQIKQNSLI